MRLISFSVAVLLASNFFGLICSGNFPQTAYIKGVRCNSSEKYVYENISCFGKSYNRSFSTVNVIATLKKSVNFAYVAVSLLYKYGTIYREVMHTPKFDWCKIMKESTNNMIIQQVLALLRDVCPSVVHECPYDSFVFQDVPARLGSLMSIFPQGDYKLIFYMYDKVDESMLVINVIGTINSQLKESFG